MSDFNKSFKRGHTEADPTSVYVDPKYASNIVGRIKRRPGVGSKEARDIAMGYAWGLPNMIYDGRCRRWHVFREKPQPH